MMKKAGKLSWEHVAKYFYFFYSALIIFYQFSVLVRIADFIMFFILLMVLQKQRVRREFANIPLKKEWWLFSFLVILSVLLSIDPLESLKMFTREYIRLGLMFWGTVYFLKTPQDLKGLLYTHLLANIILNLPGIMYIFSPEVLVSWGLADESMARYMSFNQSYTRISFYYLFVLCFCTLYIVRKDVTMKYRLFTSALLVFNLWLLLLTKTRANIVAFALSLIVITVLIYFQPRRYFYKRFINLAFLTAFFLVIIQPTGVRERIISTYHEFRDGTHSFEDRFDFVHDMNFLLNEEIKLLGYGYSRRIYRIIPDFYPAVNQRNFIHPHNQLYQWYLEHGVIGLIFFLWLALRIIKLAYHRQNSGINGAFLFIFICAIFMSFLVTSTVNHFFTQDTGKLFMILAGILNNHNRALQ